MKMTAVDWQEVACSTGNGGRLGHVFARLVRPCLKSHRCLAYMKTFNHQKARFCRVKGAARRGIRAI